MSEKPQSSQRMGLERAIEIARQSGVINMDATVSDLLDKAASLEQDASQRAVRPGGGSTGKPGGGDVAELRAWGVLINKCYVLVNECE